MCFQWHIYWVQINNSLTIPAYLSNYILPLLFLTEFCECVLTVDTHARSLQTFKIRRTPICLSVRKTLSGVTGIVTDVHLQVLIQYSLLTCRTISVVLSPALLPATHWYLPPSPSTTWSIIRVPFLCDTKWSGNVLGAMAVHVICGGGSPLAKQSMNNGYPS